MHVHMSAVFRSLARTLTRCHSTSGLNDLFNQIKISGPLSVCDYMRQCLLHPVFGYYMRGDVFGREGDFTTSPEISQVFGELLAIWVVADWRTQGEATPTQLVELGPGRGTLLQDVLRVFKHKRLSSILEGLSVHLVEASPALSSHQAQLLGVLPAAASEGNSSTAYRSGSVDGVPVFWYHDLKEIPQGHSYFIAHEFFDALPIHQFQMTPAGWREVLVDIDESKAPDRALQFVLAPSATPASAAYASGEGQEGEWQEVCPQGLVYAQELAERVVERGGAALIADYGSKERTVKSTLRAFKKHRLHDVLEDPGTADLTTDVDFTALTKVASATGAACWGPVTQNEFLHTLGIRQRTEALMAGASLSQAQDLTSSYEVLTSPKHMGERFKFLAITASPKHMPLPFRG